MKIHVQCYAGYRGEEEPRSFDLGDRRIEVMEIIDRWLYLTTATSRYGPTTACVPVLRRGAVAGEWEMSFLSQRPA